MSHSRFDVSALNLKPLRPLFCRVWIGEAQLSDTQPAFGA